MPEKAAFFHFYSAFCFIPREISGLEPFNSAHCMSLPAAVHCLRLGFRVMSCAPGWARFAIFTSRLTYVWRHLIGYRLLPFPTQSGIEPS